MISRNLVFALCAAALAVACQKGSLFSPDSGSVKATSSWSLTPPNLYYRSELGRLEKISLRESQLGNLTATIPAELAASEATDGLRITAAEPYLEFAPGDLGLGLNVETECSTKLVGGASTGEVERKVKATNLLVTQTQTALLAAVPLEVFQVAEEKLIWTCKMTFTVVHPSGGEHGFGIEGLRYYSASFDQVSSGSKAEQLEFAKVRSQSELKIEHDEKSAVDIVGRVSLICPQWTATEDQTTALQKRSTPLSERIKNLMKVETVVGKDDRSLHRSPVCLVAIDTLDESQPHTLSTIRRDLVRYQKLNFLPPPLNMSTESIFIPNPNSGWQDRIDFTVIDLKIQNPNPIAVVIRWPKPNSVKYSWFTVYSGNPTEVIKDHLGFKENCDVGLTLSPVQPNGKVTLVQGQFAVLEPGASLSLRFNFSRPDLLTLMLLHPIPNPGPHHFIVSHFGFKFLSGDAFITTLSGSDLSGRPVIMGSESLNRFVFNSEADVRQAGNQLSFPSEIVLDPSEFKRPVPFSTDRIVDLEKRPRVKEGVMDCNPPQRNL